MSPACELKLGKQSQAEYGGPTSLRRKNPFAETHSARMQVNRMGDPTVCIMRACH
jgi:hypothetical protein